MFCGAELSLPEKEEKFSDFVDDGITLDCEDESISLRKKNSRPQRTKPLPAAPVKSRKKNLDVLARALEENVSMSKRKKYNAIFIIALILVLGSILTFIFINVINDFLYNDNLTEGYKHLEDGIRRLLVSKDAEPVFQSAIVSFNKVLREDRSSVEAKFLMGIAFYYRGLCREGKDRDKDMDTMSKFMRGIISKKDKYYPQALVYMSVYCYTKENYIEANEYLDRSLESIEDIKTKDKWIEFIEDLRLKIGNETYQEVHPPLPSILKFNF